MKTACLRNLISIAFVILAFCVQNSLACTMELSPVSSFDERQYIFIGKVEEIIGAFEYQSEGKTGEIWGLKIKVTEKIYAPREFLSSYRVFHLRLTPCGDAPMFKKEE